MKSFEYDVRYIQASLEVMENYFLSEEVFWPINANPPDGMPDYPQLTLGGVLLSKERLAAYPLNHSQEVQLRQVISDLDRIRSKWRVAWEKKARHSFSVRLRMWGDYLQEYKTNPQDHADRYSYEIRLRVMLQLLKSEMGEQKRAEVDLLSGLDAYLKGVLQIGGFIWEPELQNGFPANDYWYLYGYLPPKAKGI